MGFLTTPLCTVILLGMTIVLGIRLLRMIDIVDDESKEEQI